jgi:hypothetical protein
MFNVYGDESIGPEYVAYAAIVVPENRTADAVAVLTALKEETGATAEDVLHCRQLFSGQQRQKIAWHSKSMAEVFDIYSKLLSRLAPTISRTIVSLGRISDFPTSISGDQWRHIDPNFVGPMPWSDGFEFSPKNIASMGAQAVGIPLSKWPGFEKTTFWPDPDNSMIEMAGGRRKFSSMVNCYVDHGDPATNPAGKIPVMYSRGSKPALLQVADLVAYIGQRQASNGRTPNDQRFAKLWRQINAEKIKLGIAPDGGIGINIPNEVRDFVPVTPNC